MNLTVKDNFQVIQSRIRFVARRWIWTAEPHSNEPLQTRSIWQLHTEITE